MCEHCGFDHDCDQGAAFTTTAPPPEGYASTVPFHGTKWGGAIGTGATITWSIAGAGIDVGRDDGTLSKDFTEGFDFDVEAALREAFAAWSAVANVDFVQVVDGGEGADSGLVADIRVFHADLPGSNFVAFGQFASDQPSAGTIVIDDEDPITDLDGGEPLDFIEVATHEIGHTLGFEHTSDPASIMLTSVFAGALGLGAPDILAAQAIYGAQDDGPILYELDESVADIELVEVVAGLTLIGNALGNTITGTEADEAMQGAAGDDVLIAGDGADTLDGGSGDDWIDAGFGDDVILGGEGFDRVEFLVRSTVAEITITGGEATVSSVEGADTLSEVEWLLLGDGVLALDLPGAELGFLFRLYDAVFDRAPDAGLLFWQDAMRRGLDRVEVIDAFTGSVEYAARYGADTDEAFVSLLYANVLGRAPDPAGEAYWLAQFEAGLARADMLFYFSESTENIAASAEILEAGLWFEDAQEQLAFL
ncbi:MAG: DUF4214 domain-containing protein [Pseudomonadota bacterium]